MQNVLVVFRGWKGKSCIVITENLLKGTERFALAHNLPANLDILLFLAECSACATPPSFPYVTLAVCFLVTLASAGSWQTSSYGCLCVIINCPLPSIHPPTHLINVQDFLHRE